MPASNESRQDFYYMIISRTGENNYLIVITHIYNIFLIIGASFRKIFAIAFLDISHNFVKFPTHLNLAFQVEDDLNQFKLKSAKMKSILKSQSCPGQANTQTLLHNFSSL